MIESSALTDWVSFTTRSNADSMFTAAVWERVFSDPVSESTPAR